MESGQLSAAVAAIKEKGWPTGKRIERAKIGAPGAFDVYTDGELLAALREQFARLERWTVRKMIRLRTVAEIKCRYCCCFCSRSKRCQTS
jgi:hypothetical protein